MDGWMDCWMDDCEEPLFLMRFQSISFTYLFSIANYAAPPGSSTLNSYILDINLLSSLSSYS